MATSASSLNSIRRRFVLLAEIAAQWIVGTLASDENGAAHLRSGKPEAPYIRGNTLPRYLRRDIGIDPI